MGITIFKTGPASTQVGERLISMGAAPAAALTATYIGPEKQPKSINSSESTQIIQHTIN
jgi:hypothetical protein